MGTPAMKLFMSFYMILVLVVFAYALNAFSDWIISTSMEHLSENLRIMEGGEEIVKRPRYSPLLWGTSIFVFVVGVGTVFYRYEEHCSCSYGDTWVGNESCPEDRALRAMADFDSCAASGGQVKSWIDSLYFSVTTVTTVGFGDYTPVSRGGRFFAIVWMTVGVVATGYFVSSVSNSLFAESDPMDKLNDHDASRMDSKLFKHIDKDGNGYLSRGEYYEFVLVKYGLVTEDVMDILRKKFDSLEGEEDKVTWEQIRDTRRRIRSQSKSSVKPD